MKRYASWVVLAVVLASLAFASAWVWDAASRDSLPQGLAGQR